MSRYRNCRSIATNGTEIISVGDPAGARLDAALRMACGEVDDGNRETFDGLIRAVKAAIWRRMTQPQPLGFNPDLEAAAQAAVKSAEDLQSAVANAELLNEIVGATSSILESDSPLGVELLRSIEEVGSQFCAVVASSRLARDGIERWLDQFGIAVVTPGDIHDLSSTIDQCYVICPPVFTPTSLLTAPPVERITFLIPSWFTSHQLPPSSFGTHAEGRITVAARVCPVGDHSAVVPPPSSEPPSKSDYFPSPNWGTPPDIDREPTSAEVEARRVLLAGRLSIWLDDDGEKIRALNPRLPENSRVTYEPVSKVGEGSYLVLREGATENAALLEQALTTLGSRAEGITSTQQKWKAALADRLDQLGVRRVIAELRSRNVYYANRAKAWAEPTLICPKSKDDFARMLSWLGIEQEPTLTNALDLRTAVFAASRRLREELETEVSRSDLGALERDGILRLDLDGEGGLSAMIVTRVIAVAPFKTIVHRAHARIPLDCDDAIWPE